MVVNTAVRWLRGWSLVGLCGVTTPVLAQLPSNAPYDGRPVLARVRFPVVADPAGCQDPDGLGDGGWSHDYPIDPADVPGGGATAEGGAQLYSIYQDNDPTKRLMVIATYRGILGHHWRWKGGVGSGLGEGDTPSGKAYRLGLNILVYGLSH